MATSKDDILKAIEEMSVMDLVELISAMKKSLVLLLLQQLQLPRQPRLEMQVVMLLKKKMSSTLFFLLLVIKKFK